MGLKRAQLMAQRCKDPHSLRVAREGTAARTLPGQPPVPCHVCPGAGAWRRAAFQLCSSPPAPPSELSSPGPQGEVWRLSHAPSLFCLSLQPLPAPGDASLSPGPVCPPEPAAHPCMPWFSGAMPGCFYRQQYSSASPGAVTGHERGCAGAVTNAGRLPEPHPQRAQAPPGPRFPSLTAAGGWQ